MLHLFDKIAGTSGTSVEGATLRSRARGVADVAASDAISVDLDGTFPSAAIAAAKRLKLLSLLVPTELGGEGATVSDVAEVCFTIAQSCASTAMIVAMHHSALACIVRHHLDSPWHAALLRRAAAEEFLLASSTTEGDGGGNVRSSVAPLVTTDGRVTLERQATVMSYGAQADGIVTTARRDGNTAASDQALAVFLKEDYSLAPTIAWKTLGMRGTCSAGFELKASAPATQVLPATYKTIHARTMVPVSHLLWCSVWTGIAAAAVARAQALLRASARRGDGRAPPGAPHYTRAYAALAGLRARLNVGLADFERMRDDIAKLESIDTQTSLNLLKVEISEGAAAVVSLAMRVCGLAGYREDGDFSVARHLRDILSAPIMIHNDRILANVAGAALVSPALATLEAR